MEPLVNYDTCRYVLLQQLVTLRGSTSFLQKLESVQQFFYNVLGGNWAQYLPSAFANVGECTAAAAAAAASATSDI